MYFTHNIFTNGEVMAVAFNFTQQTGYFAANTQ